MIRPARLPGQLVPSALFFKALDERIRDFFGTGRSTRGTPRWIRPQGGAPSRRLRISTMTMTSISAWACGADLRDAPRRRGGREQGCGRGARRVGCARRAAPRPAAGAAAPRAVDGSPVPPLRPLPHGWTWPQRPLPEIGRLRAIVREMSVQDAALDQKRSQRRQFRLRDLIGVAHRPECAWEGKDG